MKKKISLLLAVCMAMSIFASVVLAKPKDSTCTVTFRAIDMETEERLGTLCLDDETRRDVITRQFNKGEVITERDIPEFVNVQVIWKTKKFVKTFDHWDINPLNVTVNENMEFTAYFKETNDKPVQHVVEYWACNTFSRQFEKMLNLGDKTDCEILYIIVDDGHILTKDDIPEIKSNNPDVTTEFDRWEVEPLNAKITCDETFFALCCSESEYHTVTFRAIDEKTGNPLPMLCLNDEIRQEVITLKNERNTKLHEIPEFVKIKDNKTGDVYVFDHWNVEPYGAEIDEDMEFTAYCTAKVDEKETYIVTYRAIFVDTGKPIKELNMGKRDEDGLFITMSEISIQVNADDILTQENIPSTNGTGELPAPGTTLKFSGWNKEPNGVIVTEDIEFIAYYMSQSLVIFYSPEAHIYDYQYVDYGADAQAPELPELEGYICFGWDMEYTNVTNDLKITARYYKYGDLDMNKQIEAADATVVLRYAAKLDELTDEQKILADVSGDKLIDPSDATKILRIVAGLEK